MTDWLCEAGDGDENPVHAGNHASSVTVAAGAGPRQRHRIASDMLSDIADENQPEF